MSAMMSALRLIWKTVVFSSPGLISRTELTPTGPPVDASAPNVDRRGTVGAGVDLEAQVGHVDSSGGHRTQIDGRNQIKKRL
jgi:hypothetical protein